MSDPTTLAGRDPAEVPDPGETIDRRTRRWRGVGVVTLLAVAAGVLAGAPGLVLAGVVPVGIAALARTATPPTVTLEVDRTVSDTDPDPGDEVRVQVTVRNVGESTLTDLRVLDGVPDALTVVEGSPRHGTALRPGAETAFSYAVLVERGSHTFAPAHVLARDATGSVERATRVAATDEQTLTALPRLTASRAVPLRSRTTTLVGDRTTDEGGSGLEFHSVREYRHGDPQRRIDWKRTARTGELTTREFRQERSATVVVLVDARASASVAPAPDAPTSLDRSVTAAGEAYASLTASGHRVGIAALSPTDCWLDPGLGDAHRARTRELLGTHPALSPSASPTDGNAYRQFREIQPRLPSDAQVLLCSPLLDDAVASVARRIDARGNLVTVVSPDPTSRETVAYELAAVERALRLSELRGHGLRIVDWQADEPLATALTRAERRWSG